MPVYVLPAETSAGPAVTLVIQGKRHVLTATAAKDVYSGDGTSYEITGSAMRLQFDDASEPLDCRKVDPIVDVAAFREITIDAICIHLEQKFFDPAMKGRNWQEDCAEARKALATVKTREEFHAIARSLPEKLDTSHTAYFPPHDPRLAILRSVFETGSYVAEGRPEQPLLQGGGFFLKEIDGRRFVDQVLDGSPAEMAGLKTGDEVLSTGGAEFRSVPPDANKTFETDVKIRRTAGGPVISLDMVVHTAPAFAVLASATWESRKVIEAGHQRIGYIRGWTMLTLDTYGGPTQVLWNAIMSGEFADIDALILDARGRIGGGGVDFLNMLFGHHLPKSTRGRMDTDWQDRGSLRPDLPLVMVTDEHTRSAGEITALTVQKKRLGVLVGSQTAGAVTGGTLILLPDGGGLYVAASELMVSGQNLEGVGVSPDIKVERPLPWSGGADPQLDRAITEATRLVGQY